jgi:hypothetical protein
MRRLEAESGGWSGVESGIHRRGSEVELAEGVASGGSVDSGGDAQAKWAKANLREAQARQIGGDCRNSSGGKAVPQGEGRDSSGELPAGGAESSAEPGTPVALPTLRCFKNRRENSTLTRALLQCRGCRSFIRSDSNHFFGTFFMQVFSL